MMTKYEAKWDKLIDAVMVFEEELPQVEEEGYLGNILYHKTHLEALLDQQETEEVKSENLVPREQYIKERKENITLERQIRELHQQLECYKTANEKYKQEIESLKTECRELKKQTAGADDREKRQIRELKNQVQNLKSENQRLGQECKRKSKYEISGNRRESSLCNRPEDNTATERKHEKKPVTCKVAFVTEYPEDYDFSVLKEFFPELQIVSNKNTDSIRSAELVVFLSKNNSHKLYNKMKGFCKKTGIPYLHSDRTNAGQIYETVCHRIS